MRFRLHFTVRTLAIVVTLVCAYFGAWEATKKAATSMFKDNDFDAARDLRARMFLSRHFIAEVRADAPLPFVIGQSVIVPHETTSSPKLSRRYYLWLFGPKIKLPFESYWR